MMLPPPPISPEVDLSDYPKMPLDIIKLKESGFIIKATPEEFRAAVILWAVSWHQVPAGSLPSEDSELAYLAGYGRSIKDWLKVREMALSKWVLCEDGRLYHPLIVENALAALRKKRNQIDRSVKGAMARWHKNSLDSGNTTGNALGISSSIPISNSSGKTTSNPTGNAKLMPNECQGRGIEKDLKDPPIAPQVYSNGHHPKTSKNAFVYSPEFESFWKSYPRKTAKGAAYKAWKKETPPLDVCLNALEWQKKSFDWTKEKGAFIPHPATWINSRRWEDEIPVTQKPKVCL